MAAGLAGANWALDAPSFLTGDRSPGAGLLVIAIAPALLAPDFPQRLRLQLDRLASLGVHIPGRRAAAAEIELPDALVAEHRARRGDLIPRPGDRATHQTARQDEWNDEGEASENRCGSAVCRQPLGARLSFGASRSAGTRVRPGDPAWPSDESWDELNREVEGRLIKVRSPLAACVGASSDATCAQVFKELKNPYYLGDEVGLTQSLGWVGAWTSQPSVYAVAAKTTRDVVAAVNFARKNNLRLVVKGGGHSYQGTSNAADSLLIWTRHMNAIVLHDAFVGAGCAGQRGAAAGRVDRGRRILATGL